MRSTEYHEKIYHIFQNIFGEKNVEKEWDSVKYDPHLSSHKTTYAPRHDIAVGPFNDYSDLDCGIDNTKCMQSHPLFKSLFRDKFVAGCELKDVWNSFSRCFIAVEIEFNGTSKHIMGSIINASVSGSIGIVIGNRKNIQKIWRIYHYIGRLEELERLQLRTLGNLVIFEENEFLDLILTPK
jgi:hypothetical protein